MTRVEAIALLRTVIAHCEANAADRDLAVLHMRQELEGANDDTRAVYALDIQNKENQARGSRECAARCRALLAEWGATRPATGDDNG